MKLKNRKRFFIHAPAFYGNKDAETGEFVSRRLRNIQNPFDDETKPWRRNIYYFWWEFLKRHEGYRKCCERGGTGNTANFTRTGATFTNIRTSGNGGVKKSKQQKHVVSIYSLNLTNFDRSKKFGHWMTKMKMT